MTLDEAIEHAREKAIGCDKCAREHDQLADWLEELKERREKNEKVYYSATERFTKKDFRGENSVI